MHKQTLKNLLQCITGTRLLNNFAGIFFPTSMRQNHAMEDKQDPNRIPQEAPYILSPEELESFRKSFDTLPSFPPIREPILSVRFGTPKLGIPYPDNSCLDYICGYVDVSIEFNSGQHRRARINLAELGFPFYPEQYTAYNLASILYYQKEK